MSYSPEIIALSVFLVLVAATVVTVTTDALVVVFESMPLSGNDCCRLSLCLLQQRYVRELGSFLRHRSLNWKLALLLPLRGVSCARYCRLMGGMLSNAAPSLIMCCGRPLDQGWGRVVAQIMGPADPFYVESGSFHEDRDQFPPGSALSV